MDGRCVIIMLSFAFLAPRFCAAQDERLSLVSPNSSDNSCELLVLVDGEVLNGRFTPRPDGYDVRVAAGRKFISADQVRFIASDLQDAYQRMRLSQPELTPEIHVELARWCLANKLPDEAHREVLDALHLDPHRTDAKRILAALLENSGSPGRSKFGSRLTEYPSTRKSFGPLAETRSLAGFSRSVAQEFTRHVQPLLMNKCANAGCHGGGTGSSFQLASAHRVSSPIIAERNLAAVLKQIDLARPATSPLLVEVERTHGNLNAPLFQGRLGAQQLDVLRNWVIAAANDIAPNANQENQAVERDIRLTSAGKVSGDTSALSHRINDDNETPHGRRLTSAETDPTFLAEATRANAHDEFDPSVFNQKFHGRTGLEHNAEPTETMSEPEESDPAGGTL